MKVEKKEGATNYCYDYTSDFINKLRTQKRLISKIKIKGNCWEYQGSKDKLGYGYFWYNGKQQSAHRISFHLFNGELVKGLVIDHLCRNTSCVNPCHLEQVTITENVMRGNTICAINKDKTHCRKGHEFTEENTYLAPRKNRQSDRQCRTCRTAQWKQYSKERRYRK